MIEPRVNINTQALTGRFNRLETKGHLNVICGMPTPKPIGFAPPPIDDDTIAAVTDVLRSGWITSGPELMAFERELEAYMNVRHVACFSSWTTACELALRWFGVGPGDEVIIPAMTYAATANIVLHCGATPVLVDIDPTERVITASAILPLIGPRTKVVMPVDLGGWPVDYDAISAVLKSEETRATFQAQNDVQAKLGRPLFLSDAAHSFGANYAGEPVGSQADITGFSFHAVKNLTTAEGGALTFNLPDTFEMSGILGWFKAMALHGQSKSALEKTTTGSWHYDVVEAGYKCNMTDLQAAIGRAQLRKYPDQLQRRAAIANQYHAGFQAFSWYESPPLADAMRTSSYHLFQLRIKGVSSAQRDGIMRTLKAQGIATNVHFQPLPMLTLHKRRGERVADYPESARLFEESLSLPIHLELSDGDVDRVVQAVKDAVEMAMNS